MTTWGPFRQWITQWHKAPWWKQSNTEPLLSFMTQSTHTILMKTPSSPLHARVDLVPPACTLTLTPPIQKVGHCGRKKISSIYWDWYKSIRQLHTDSKEIKAIKLWHWISIQLDLIQHIFNIYETTHLVESWIYIYIQYLTKFYDKSPCRYTEKIIQIQKNIPKVFFFN